jgi:hypothetical protein
MTVCIVSNPNRAASVSGFGDMQDAGAAGKMQLKMTFAAPVRDLKNERTGKPLGNGTVFEDEFTPWEAGVYSFVK